MGGTSPDSATIGAPTPTTLARSGSPLAGTRTSAASQSTQRATFGTAGMLDILMLETRALWLMFHGAAAA
jgi:hypothetical protein